MHSRRFLPVALAALALSAPAAAQAKFMDYPGPEDQSVTPPAAQTTQMQARRDAGAPNPPAVVTAARPPHTSHDLGGAEVPLLAVFGVVLAGAGVVTARRRRVAA